MVYTRVADTGIPLCVFKYEVMLCGWPRYARLRSPGEIDALDQLESLQWLVDHGEIFFERVPPKVVLALVVTHGLYGMVGPGATLGRRDEGTKRQTRPAETRSKRRTRGTGIHTIRYIPDWYLLLERRGLC